MPLTNRVKETDHVHDTPDLSDPATIGCLLALVREAHEQNRIYVYPEYRKQATHPEAEWTVSGIPFLANDAVTLQSHWPTEAHALVAALKAAP
jgi:hypothetical protein